jgi:hypothetical protein
MLLLVGVLEVVVPMKEARIMLIHRVEIRLQTEIPLLIQEEMVRIILETAAAAAAAAAVTLAEMVKPMLQETDKLVVEQVM